jgi:hypothetical protein
LAAKISQSYSVRECTREKPKFFQVVVAGTLRFPSALAAGLMVTLDPPETTVGPGIRPVSAVVNELTKWS